MKCNNFYKEIAKAFVDARTKKGLTLWELSKLVNEQINTVKRIEEGKPFAFHHTLWMRSVLDMDIDIILAGIKTKGVSNGRKESKGASPQGKAVCNRTVTASDLI